MDLMASTQLIRHIRQDYRAVALAGIREPGHCRFAIEPWANR